jgi:hypothetical protein
VTGGWLDFLGLNSGKGRIFLFAATGFWWSPYLFFSPNEHLRAFFLSEAAGA